MRILLKLMAIVSTACVHAGAYEDCLLDNLKGVSSDYAAKKIDAACSQKYGAPSQKVKDLISNINQETANAKIYCEAEALRKYPVKDLNDKGYNIHCTNHGDLMNCDTSEKAQYSWLKDVNKVSREIAYSQCFNARQKAPTNFKPKSSDGIDCSSSNLTYYQKSVCSGRVVDF